MSKLNTWVLFAGLLFSIAVPELFAQSLTAELSKSRVAVGEPFRVTYKIDNGSGQVRPEFGRLELIGGPDIFSSFTEINQNVSRSEAHSFTLRAPAPGRYPIPGISVKVGNKTLRSNALQVEVTDAPPKESGSKTGKTVNPSEKIAKNLILKARLAKTRCYQGEQVRLEFRLYTQLNINEVSIDALTPPKLDGLWKEEIVSGPAAWERDQMNGQNYNAVTLKTYIIFPQQSGSIGISAAAVSGSVRIVTETPDPDAMNPFSGLFDRYQNYPFEVESQPLALTALPLPEKGRPANFNGLIGQFRLDASMNRSEVRTGDPVTLGLTLSGSGNFNMVTAPRFDVPADIELYDPQTSQQLAVAREGISGSQRFDYLLIPKTPGKHKIPPVSLSFFDPSSGQYKLLNTPEFSFTASGDAIAAPKTNQGPALLKEDIRYLHKDFQLNLQNRAFPQRAIYWVLWFSAWIAAAVGIFYFRRRQRYESNPATQKFRLAHRNALKRMEQSRALIESQQRAAFYEAAEKNLLQYLSDKLDQPTGSMTRSQLLDALQARAIEPGYCNQVGAFLESCEWVRFAPGAAGPELKDSAREIQELIGNLEASFNRHRT